MSALPTLSITGTAGFFFVCLFVFSLSQSLYVHILSIHFPEKSSYCSLEPRIHFSMPKSYPDLLMLMGESRSDFVCSSLGLKQTGLRVAFLCSYGAGGHSLSSHRTQKRLLVAVDRNFLSVFSQEARCTATRRGDSHCPSRQGKHDVLART